MMVALASLAFLLVTYADFVAAEEPKGFADVLWGTPRKNLLQRFTAAECDPLTVQLYQRIKEAILCAEYRVLDDLPP